MATETAEEKRKRIKEAVEEHLASLPATADGLVWAAVVKNGKIYLTKVKKKV